MDDLDRRALDAADDYDAARRPRLRSQREAWLAAARRPDRDDGPLFTRGGGGSPRPTSPDGAAAGASAREVTGMTIMRVVLVVTMGLLSGCRFGTVETGTSEGCLPSELLHVYCPPGTIWVSQHNPACQFECDPDLGDDD